MGPVLATPLKQEVLAETLVNVGPVRWLKDHFVVVAALLSAVFYAYWPTLIWMEDAWRNEPDYSHGYLVPILAVLLCWHRRDSFPGIRTTPSWGGLSLVVLAIVMRVVGRLIYADFLDAWSILPLISGLVWVVLGPAALKWASPAIAFLFLMFPLPYQAESMMSWKLQGIATDLSTVFLRILGQPAVAEGHVIWFNEERLLVEEACSGLRIFIGVAALAFFWSAMVKRSWVDRLVLLASVLPLAVFVNAVRITTVGILYQFYDDIQIQDRIHDISGYLMIPFAFGLLWLLKTYWEHLYRPVELLTAKDFVPRSA
ncbi:MAG: exosortase/archaeosortase family protein [Planctomycetota bacterium]